jgi:hypothetical protein
MMSGRLMLGAAHPSGSRLKLDHSTECAAEKGTSGSKGGPDYAAYKPKIIDLQIFVGTLATRKHGLP